MQNSTQATASKRYPARRFHKTWNTKPGYRCGHCYQPLPAVKRKRKSRPDSCLDCTPFGFRCEKHDAYCDDCLSPICDCGTIKPPSRPMPSRTLFKPACDRCIEMDGATFQMLQAVNVSPGRIGNAEQDLVSTLRTTGRSNWDTLTLEIPWMTKRQLHRGMVRLMESGRVRRHIVPSFLEMGWHGEEAEFDLVGVAMPSVTNS